MVKPGYRVVRKGWEGFEEHQHLARRGTIIDKPVLGIGYPLSVRVRWDGSRNVDAPPRVALESVAELSWQWWRST